MRNDFESPLRHAATVWSNPAPFPSFVLLQQVLSTLGNVKGLRVLELGAGIGRFTGELAKTGEQTLLQHSRRS